MIRDALRAAFAHPECDVLCVRPDGVQLPLLEMGAACPVAMGSPPLSEDLWIMFRHVPRIYIYIFIYIYENQMDAVPRILNMHDFL